MKLFNDLHYLLMSRIIFPLGFIFPLDSICPHSICPLEIVKWFTLFTHVPYNFPPGFILPPYNFAPVLFCPPPWKSFNDLHYLPMFHIIFPLDSSCPVWFCPPPPYEIAPLKSFNDLHFLPMSHIISPWICPISFCHRITPPPPP